MLRAWLRNEQGDLARLWMTEIYVCMYVKESERARERKREGGAENEKKSKKKVKKSIWEGCGGLEVFECVVPAAGVGGGCC
mmetsp:Transcript_5361/g.11297  ORF Transcript_5361/g.11297 Transcript_5361/m.11297 type:complete len:81 (+) Transcript_5361:1191-1433(+)